MSNSNATMVEVYQDLHTILLMSIQTIGIIIGIFCIIIVILSKPKLILTEFYILMTISISLIIFKIIIDSQFVLMLISHEFIGYCFFAILNLSNITFGFYILLTFFYYSLFQVSNVSRSRLFVLLHGLVHKKKTFIIYQIGIGFLSMFIFLLYFFMAYTDLNQCPNVFFLMNKITNNGSLIIQMVFACSLPIFVYLSTTVYIFFSSNRRISITNNSMVNDRSGKNLNVLLKFLTLAVLFVFSFWLLNLFYFLSFIFPNAISTLATAYTSFISFSLMHLFLIIVHSITKTTFKTYILKIFRFR